MLFNTRYNQAQKYTPEVKRGESRPAPDLDEAQFVTANMRRTLLRLQNRDLFVERMDKIEDSGRKYLGRASRD